MGMPCVSRVWTLNLLVALDVLLTERNVSRAADILCLSQSATSGVLARLRDYFGDELLVQVGRKMVLPPRAATLSDRVRSALVQIDGTIIQKPGFDPQTAERQISVITSDFVAVVALTDAIRFINAQAPRLSFVIEPPLDRPRERLERGDIDLLLMPQRYLSLDHPSEPLFSDRYCVAVWANSAKFGETISEQEFFDARHVTVKFPSMMPSYETWFIKQRGDGKIDAVVGSFLAMPFMLAGTDRLAVMHERLAQIFSRVLPIRIIPCPIDIPDVVECLQWHSFNAADECLAWVRQEFHALVRN